MSGEGRNGGFSIEGVNRDQLVLLLDRLEDWIRKESPLWP